jgi:hypothetical protein
MLAVFDRVSTLLFTTTIVASVSLTGLLRAGEVDTEHLFGFTAGANVGNVGERELESELTNRAGKRAGAYNALSQSLEAKITPIENFRLSGATALAYFGISGVPGLADRQQTTLQGLTFDARYKLIEDGPGPFALTIIGAPRWDRLDDISGEPARGYGGALVAAIEKELMAGSVFGALNLIYDAEATHLIVADRWQHDSKIGIAAAVSTAVRPAFFIGGEVRYFRAYSGLGLDRFAGHAVFAGPTMYYQFSKQFAVSAAWDFQVSGRATVGDGLELTRFERQQAKLRLNYIFH